MPVGERGPLKNCWYPKCARDRDNKENPRVWSEERPQNLAAMFPLSLAVPTQGPSSPWTAGRPDSPKGGCLGLGDYRERTRSKAWLHEPKGLKMEHCNALTARASVVPYLESGGGLPTNRHTATSQIALEPREKKN
jgi:hypothetical protein